MYANIDGFTFSEAEIPVEERPELDQWIISLLNLLVKDVAESYETYEPTRAGRAISEFVSENLSNWFVRLSRKRYWGGSYDKDKISELGFIVSPYDIKGKTETQLVNDLSKFDAIFMEGGSTEYLLKQVKISGFDIDIIKLLDKGIIYIGSSAGSCIMGKSIEHLCELDHFQIQDSVEYAGIGLVPHLMVPHYGRDKYEGRHAKMKEVWGDKLTFLTDNQAILVNGDKIEIVTNQGGL
jgi:peptidase E